jgi:hypothetical protein
VPRRLDPASIFERLFSTYAAQFTLIFPAAIIVFIPVAVISAVVRTEDIGLRFLLQIVTAVATYWLQGMVVEAVRDIQDGRRDFTLGGLFAAVTPVLGSLVLAGVLASIGTTIGLILLIVPGLILLTWWAVIVPVIVIERVPALQAFGRSRELVRGNGWQVFSIIAVIFILQVLAGILLGAVLQSADSAVGAGIAAIAGGALLAPISAIGAALVYLDLSAGRDAAPEAPAADAWPSAPEGPPPGA